MRGVRGLLDEGHRPRDDFRVASPALDAMCRGPVSAGVSRGAQDRRRLAAALWPRRRNEGGPFVPRGARYRSAGRDHMHVPPRGRASARSCAGAGADLMRPGTFALAVLRRRLFFAKTEETPLNAGDPGPRRPPRLDPDVPRSGPGQIRKAPDHRPTTLFVGRELRRTGGEPPNRGAASSHRPLAHPLRSPRRLSALRIISSWATELGRGRLRRRESAAWRVMSSRSPSPLARADIENVVAAAPSRGRLEPRPRRAFTASCARPHSGQLAPGLDRSLLRAAPRCVSGARPSLPLRVAERDILTHMVMFRTRFDSCSAALSDATRRGFLEQPASMLVTTLPSVQHDADG